MHLLSLSWIVNNSLFSTTWLFFFLVLVYCPRKMITSRPLARKKRFI